MKGPVWHQQNFELVLSYAPADGSSLGEATYTVPLSDSLELGMGVDIFQGAILSQFGMFRQGSRGFLLLRGYFNG